MVLFSYQHQMATINESEMLVLDAYLYRLLSKNQVVSRIAKTEGLYVYLMCLPLKQQAFYT